MALSPVTPRDRLQRLVDLARKTWRYWWLVAVLAVVGIGLSLAFAVTRPRTYLSWATLFYQERIQSALLSPNKEEIAQRNIGDRYRELLLARKQLEQILNDPTLDPYPTVKDQDLKMEKLRLAVHFTARGAMAFRIEYTDSDPDRARRVTDKLTRLLQETEEAMRNEQAAETVAFATEQKNTAAAEVKTAEAALTKFLADNPEFVADSAASSEGASIRAAHSNKPTSTGGSPRLSGAERQLRRIEALLDAPPDAPPIRVPVPSSPERIAAEAAVQDAQRELAAAKRELDDALSKFTDQHPTVIKAKDKVDNAQQKLRAAQAAVPADVETLVRPTTAPDRAKLEKERQQLMAEIRDEQSRTGKTPEAPTSTEAQVVQLESENTELRRVVKERRERLETLTQGEFRARQDANQKLAEQGGRLSIVDPAFKPVRPNGPGKTIFLMAGTVLFFAIGLGLAVTLAVIDDRLYRRADLDYLGVPVLAVIPPPARVARKSRSRAPGKTRTKTKANDKDKDKDKGGAA